jgi:uncharacterized lipoprotein YddW (UPF0748 family)
MRALLVGLFLFVTAVVPVTATQIPPETRALWVVRTSLTSRAGIVAMVAAAKASGFNTLFVQVRGRGDAYYASRVEPRAAALAKEPVSFDPLAVVIQEARAAGLSVHAWVNIHLVADMNDMPADRKHVVRRHPDWLMLPRDLVPTLGRMNPKDPRYVAGLVAWSRAHASVVEGLYLSPFNRGAVEHLVEVVEDLAAHYPLDGIHFDYIRFPGPQYDFSRAALESFSLVVNRTLSKREKRALKQAVRKDPLTYVERYPSTWQDTRRERVTSLLRQLRAVVRARRPSAMVTAAVVPDTTIARDSRGQDWPQWLALGLLDGVCPMAYTTDADTFRDQMATARAASSGHVFLAGIGAYRLSQAQTIRHIGLAREAGADGIILFSYDSLIAADRGPDQLGQIGRAVFFR